MLGAFYEAAVPCQVKSSNHVIFVLLRHTCPMDCGNVGIRSEDFHISIGRFQSSSPSTSCTSGRAPGALHQTSIRARRGRGHSPAHEAMRGRTGRWRILGDGSYERPWHRTRSAPTVGVRHSSCLALSLMRRAPFVVGARLESRSRPATSQRGCVPGVALTRRRRSAARGAPPVPAPRRAMPPLRDYAPAK